MNMQRPDDEILTELVNLGQKEQNPAFVPFEPADLEFTNRVNLSNSQGQPNEINYDSTIDCKVLRDDYDKVFPVNYGRYNLSAKHPDGIEIEYEGETSTQALLAKINAVAAINLTTDSALNQAIVPPTNFPAGVTVQARPEARMYRGQLQVILLGEETVDDSSFLTAPVTTNGDSVADEFQDENNLLFVGEGNPPGELIVANNSEIEIAVGARIFNNATLPDGSGGNYAFNIDSDEDWNIPFALGLLDKRNGAVITNLYDVKLEITSAETTETLELTLTRPGGVYHLVNEANNIDIVDGYASNDGSIYQEIQRASFYTAALGNPTANTAGGLLGEYEITLTATRKQGGKPPVTVTTTVTVSALA